MIEVNEDACATLRENRPNWKVICDDIANISQLNLEEYFSIKCCREAGAWIIS